MLLRVFMAGALALALQGCAGTPSALDAADHTALQSLALFDAHGGARFAIELTCMGEETSCDTVEHAFSGWADSRHIALHDRAPDAPAGGGRRLPSASDPSVPYRLAVTVAPVLVPSIDLTHVDQSGGLTGAGYTPPRVGYRATIRVIDAASGARLREVSAAQQRTADYHADANSYLRAEVNGLIANLDPAYRP